MMHKAGILSVPETDGTVLRLACFPCSMAVLFWARSGGRGNLLRTLPGKMTGLRDLS